MESRCSGLELIRDAHTSVLVGVCTDLYENPKSFGFAWDVIIRQCRDDLFWWERLKIWIHTRRLPVEIEEV